MTEAMPFLQKYDITFLRPPLIWAVAFFYNDFTFCCALALHSSGILADVQKRGTAWKYDWRTSQRVLKKSRS